VNRLTRGVVFGTAAAAAGIAAGVVAQRRAVGRARAVPDPVAHQPFAKRPGRALPVTSFDGTTLAAWLVGPSRARTGNGPVLVFAHGFSLDMSTWYFQWRELSRRYRCVLFDQRGHGASAPAGPAGYTVEALAGDLRVILDAAVGDESAILIGHSMGGMGILALAQEHPKEFGGRVAGVVLADTGSGMLVKEALGDLAVRATAAARRAAASVGRRPRIGAAARRFALGRGRDLAYLAARATNFGPNAPPSVVDHVTKVASSTPAEVWPPTLISLLELDLAAALARIAVPALVVVGEHDRITPPGGARALAAQLPDGRLVVISGAGHVAMMEQPGPFNAELEAFLREMEAGAPVEAPA
jgi:pimeloyl-ACP methyl ester carboxylesterase